MTDDKDLTTPPTPKDEPSTTSADDPSAVQPDGPPATSADGQKRKRKARGRIEALEQRILLSATWVDAHTGELLDGPTASDDAFTGTEAADVADALDGDDVLQGLAGDDILSGNDGADSLFGDTGDDSLFGGAGDDSLHGGEGSDTLSGGEGDDVIFAGESHGGVPASDVIDGGAGSDTADYSNAGAAVNVDLTTGTVSGATEADTLTNIESVVGSDYDDTFSFSSPSAGDTYSVDGGGGDNTIDLSNFDRAAATFSHGEITIDLGDGQSLSIEHENIDHVQFNGQRVNLVTWDGEAASADWSDAANWSNDTVPGADDILIFDGTSSDDATFDAEFSGTIGGLQVSRDYSGTIELTDSLTINGDVDLAAGTLDAGDHPVDIAGDLNISGGEFRADAATTFVTGDLTVTDGLFVQESGTLTVTGDIAHSGGSVDISGATLALVGNSKSIDVTPEFVVGDLDINMAWNQSLNLASDVTVTGDLTISQVNEINGGTISVAGNVTSTDSSVGDNSTGTIALTGDGDQVLSGGGNEGDLPNLSIAKTGGSVTITDPVTVDG
ncbi:MAG: LEPR-XLL domain-containing protein, partial [Planctomycetes bacterium]|nr:LEPR-XLL domain-containing protein [Planctomycetota bacterium]